MTGLAIICLGDVYSALLGVYLDELKANLSKKHGPRVLRDAACVAT